MSPERGNMTIFLCLIVLLSSSEDVYGASKIPDYVMKCSRSVLTELGDPCMQSNVDILKRKLAQGIPEFRIPPMEPFFVESITFASPTFREEVSNATITGATNFDVLDMTFDYQKLTWILNVRFNSIYVNGTCHVSGRLLALQLESQGKSWLEASNIEAFVDMHMKIREERGKKYIDCSDRSQQKVKLTFNEKPVIYFENLFPGNEELTRITNAVLNDNIMDILTDIMPILNEVIGTFVFNSMQSVFDLFPVDELFLP